MNSFKALLTIFNFLVSFFGISEITNFSAIDVFNTDSRHSINKFSICPINSFCVNLLYSLHDFILGSKRHFFISY